MTVAHPTTPQDLKSIARLTLSIDFDPLLVSDSVRFCVPFFSQVPKLAPPKKILILLPAGPSAGAAGLLFSTRTPRSLRLAGFDAGIHLPTPDAGALLFQ